MDTHDQNAVTQYAVWIYKERYIMGLSDDQDGKCQLRRRIGFYIMRSLIVRQFEI